MLPQMATPKEKGEKYSKRAYALTALLRQQGLGWFAFDQPGLCVAAEKRRSLSAACPLAGSLSTSQAPGSLSTEGGFHMFEHPPRMMPYGALGSSAWLMDRCLLLRLPGEVI